jgi:hypothetical protein
MSFSITGLGPPTGSPPPPEEAPTPTPTPTPSDQDLGLGPLDPSTVAESAAFDEPLLTDIESGAAQLSSTAFPEGISNPFASAQDGWMVGSPTVDPYSNVATGEGSFYAFVGQNVDYYSGLQPVGDNTNAYTTGQNVNALLGFEDAPSSAAAPADPTNPFSPPVGFLPENSQNMLAQNSDPTAPPPPPGGGFTLDWPPKFVPAPTPTTEGGGTPQGSAAPGSGTQPGNGLQQAPTATSAPLNQDQGSWEPRFESGPWGSPLGLVASGGSEGPRWSPSAAWLPPQPPRAGLPRGTSTVPSAADQQSVFHQVLSGTYAASILQRQLASQGRAPGVFVSPNPPFDLLFSPNAQTLGEAQLLASRPGNTELERALGLQATVSNLPILGSVATWMNPNSGRFGKGLAVVGGVLSVVPLGAELGAMLKESVAELAALLEELGLVSVSVEELAPLIREVELGNLSPQAVGEVTEFLQAARDAGFRISASGPSTWTQSQVEAANAYREAYAAVLKAGGSESAAAGAGGDAFHEALGAAQRGIDTTYFGANVELKTSVGTPDIRALLDAVRQSEGYAPGQLNAVHYFDVLNGVKYFIQWSGEL